MPVTVELKPLPEGYVSLGAHWGYRVMYAVPEEPPRAFWIAHRKPDGSWCIGVSYVESSAAAKDRPVWQLVKRGPLTLSPSVWCRSPEHPDDGVSHGFIQEGRWVPAGELPSWAR